jgi:hypothetical protein
MNFKTQARKKHGIIWSPSVKERLVITDLFITSMKLKEVSLALTFKHKVV